MYSIRILLNQPLRFFLTIGGIGLCIVLMLFLLGVYRGVEVGSVEYIRKNKADLWILQDGTNNILRATSILSTAHGYVINDHPDVKMASPILLLLSTIEKGDRFYFLKLLPLLKTSSWCFTLPVTMGMKKITKH